MSAKATYDSVFVETFLIEQTDVEIASTTTVSAWDSIGKLNLVAALEDAFDIELETEDIIAFNSYADGMNILKKYGIEL